MKKFSKYILTTLVVGSLTSCEMLSDFGDTNLNPSATNSPTYAALLTNVQAGLGGYAAQTTPGYFCQYFSETQYSSSSLYAIPQVDFTGNYSASLYDLENIITTSGNKSMSAISKILQQYIYWNMTDRWGDIPYSEALKGAESTRPKYDTQENIYKGMIQALKDANGMFDGSLISGDVIYGGDVAAWKRAANSMRVLMAIQLSKKFPAASAYAATELKAALADGVITSNAQNFKISYPGGNFQSPWFNLYNGRRDVAESATLVNLMGSLSDGRQAAFGGETEEQGVANSNNSSSIGVPYGVERAKAEAFTGANPKWARVLRGDFRTPTGSVVIISAAQVALARAEAADLGWTSESLNTVYQDGIKLSFDQWGLSAPAASYFTQAGVTLSAAGTGANLKNISIQRYIASYPDGLQGWNITRKSGFPALTPAPDAVNSSKKIPERYVYATGEYSSNKVSVEDAVKRVAAYDQDAKVWWNQ
ncbi:MAG: SusD/RagB family nutrient-binding outer membrane lipoprotein [Cytophagaceae bacterium]|nr:SusD/RagB family nutrient-binding outer membrane lipoprotein [Cytophagaceae bacterium]